jgi:translation initiation factor 4A
MSSEDNEKFFTEWEETFDSFDQMGLHENLLRGIYAYGEARAASQSCS